MSIKVLNIAGLALSALTLTLSLGSCGKVAAGGPALLDSNTNWLMRCSADGQCSGSLRCYCGICTKPCGENAECGLLSGSACAESGESLCGEHASAGGLCVLSCTADSECGAGFSCSAGQCVPKPCVTLGARGWDDVFVDIRTDLSTADADDRPFLRYFEIGNSSADTDSGGACGVAPDVKLQALSKLLNSLSLQATIRTPAAIVDHHLYRIDLRDYSWDRLVIVNGAHTDVWEALAASDPYATVFVGDDADAVLADTGTLTPVLLVDSFIATATQSSMYYGLLDVPQALGPFTTSGLGIPLSQQPSVEAGFVDRAEMLAEYWPTATRAGYLWSIADFGRGAGALFADPFQDPLGERELVYTLPNGLNAFAFMGPDGQRLDVWRVTTDSEERDGAARVPRSNWRRHSPIVNVRDEVHDYVAGRPNLYPSGDLALLRQRFPGPQELSLLLERDHQAFTSPALFALGVDDSQPDPILTSFAEFDGNMTLEVAAAELMVVPESLRQNLVLLDPALAPLASGTVERSVFTAVYHQSLCLLGTILNNQPDPSTCP